MRIAAGRAGVDALGMQQTGQQPCDLNVECAQPAQTTIWPHGTNACVGSSLMQTMHVRSSSDDRAILVRLLHDHDPNRV